MATLLFDRSQFPDLTYSDVFLVPNNPVMDRIRQVATSAEFDELQRLHARTLGFRDEQHSTDEALSAHREYQACLFALADQYPDVARVISRDQVDFAPPNGFGNVPVMIANMNAVCGKRMAEVMAMMGGSAALPQDKTDDELRDIGAYMHSRDVRYMTPLTLKANAKLHEVRPLLEKRDMDTVAVVDDAGKFVGIVRLQQAGAEGSQGVIPAGMNPDSPITPFIRKDCITAPDGISEEDTIELMDKHRIHFLPIVDAEGTLKGVRTKKFAAMRWRYKPFVDEVNGGLAVVATIGAVNNNPVDRLRFLINEVGVKGIVLDTAHFDQGLLTYRNIQRARDIIEQSRQQITLIAGNMVTKAATADTIAAGADIVKVGIGPGAMCTTRIETGVGRPQLSVLQECGPEAARLGKHVMADGGIQYPRDVALAMAVDGVSHVMMGSVFVATKESPAPFESDERGLYKVNSGMASRQSAELRSFGRERRSMQDHFRAMVGQRAEGINAGKVYVKPGMDTVSSLLHWYIDGLTSSMTYAGSRNILEFQDYALIGIQTSSGYEEGKPKHVS